MSCANNVWWTKTLPLPVLVVAMVQRHSAPHARKHLHTHHKDLSERLLKMDGRVRVGEAAGMDKFVQPAPSHKRGPACQNALETLDAMVQMVLEELEPWDRLQSAPFRNSRGASTLMRGCLRSKQSSNTRVLGYVPLPVYMSSEMVKCRMCVNTNGNNCV